MWEQMVLKDLSTLSKDVTVSDIPDSPYIKCTDVQNTKFVLSFSNSLVVVM